MIELTAKHSVKLWYLPAEPLITSANTERNTRKETKGISETGAETMALESLSQSISHNTYIPKSDKPPPRRLLACPPPNEHRHRLIRNEES